MKFCSRVIVLTLLMVFVISSGVFAAQYPKIEVTPHEVTTQEADLIAYWDNYLMEPVDGYVEVGGTTETYDVVDNVEVVIELQKKEGSSWKTIESWSDYEFDDYIVSTAKTYKVEKGYWYRVVSHHYAEDDGSSENVYAYGKELFIE